MKPLVLFFMACLTLSQLPGETITRTHPILLPPYFEEFDAVPDTGTAPFCGPTRDIRPFMVRNWITVRDDPEQLAQYLSRHLPITFPEGTHVHYQHLPPALVLKHTEDAHAVLDYGLMCMQVTTGHQELILQLLMFPEEEIQQRERQARAPLSTETYLQIWREGHAKTVYQRHHRIRSDMYLYDLDIFSASRTIGSDILHLSINSVFPIEAIEPDGQNLTLHLVDLHARLHPNRPTKVAESMTPDQKYRVILLATFHHISPHGAISRLPAPEGPDGIQTRHLHLKPSDLHNLLAPFTGAEPIDILSRNPIHRRRTYQLDMAALQTLLETECNVPFPDHTSLSYSSTMSLLTVQHTEAATNQIHDFLNSQMRTLQRQQALHLRIIEFSEDARPPRGEGPFGGHADAMTVWQHWQDGNGELYVAQQIMTRGRTARTGLSLHRSHPYAKRLDASLPEDHPDHVTDWSQIAEGPHLHISNPKSSRYVLMDADWLTPESSPPTPHLPAMHGWSIRSSFVLNTDRPRTQPQRLFSHTDPATGNLRVGLIFIEAN